MFEVLRGFANILWGPKILSIRNSCIAPPCAAFNFWSFADFIDSILSFLEVSTYLHISWYDNKNSLWVYLHLWFSVIFCSVVTAPKLDSSSPGASPDVWFVRVSLNFLNYSVLFHSLWYQVKISLWNSDISLLEKGWGNKIFSSIWILFIIGNQRPLAPAVIMIIL